MIAKDRTRRLARLERQLAHAGGAARDRADDVRTALRDPGAPDIPESVRRLGVRLRLAAMQAWLSEASTATDVQTQLAAIGIDLLPAELAMLARLAAASAAAPTHEHGVVDGPA